MKRVFSVELESVKFATRMYPLRPVYEVVADTAIDAIGKALRQAKRDYAYRGAYIVTQLKHRGAAV